MKGHKAHHHTAQKIEHHIAKHRKAGGKAESPMRGKDEEEEDLKEKPEARTNAKKVDAEAEERKEGGKVEGKKAKHHAGKKMRKAGGMVESSPFSHAEHGTPAKGRKFERQTMGRD